VTGWLSVAKRGMTDRWNSAAATPVRRDLLGSVATAFAGQLFLVVSGVLAARLLGPEDRGYLALLTLIPAAVSQAGHLGLATGMTFYIARAPSNLVAILKTMRGAIGLQVAALTAVHGLILLLVIADDPTRVRQAGLMTLVLVPTGFTLEYCLAILQGSRAFTPFNVIRSSWAALYAFFLVILYIFGSVSLVGVVASLVAISFSTAVAAAVLAYRQSRVSEERGRPSPVPSRSEIAGFGVKGYLGAQSPIEALRLDQAIVALFLSPTALGLYVAALAFTNLPRFIGQSIGLVAYPHVAHQPDEVAARRSVWRFGVLAAAICVPISLAVILTVNSLLPFFFGRTFSDAAEPAKLLMIAALFAALRRVLADGARGLGRPLVGTVAEVLTWASFVCLLLVLHPSRGPETVAAALAGAAAAGLILTVLLLASSRGNSPTNRGASVFNRPSASPDVAEGSR
jgi:O-antigen/teichoic acid export membrane protein